MRTSKITYKCRVCGCPNYQPVIDRIQGALKPTGQYKCAGCRNVFETLSAWCQPKRVEDFSHSKLSSA